MVQPKNKNSPFKMNKPTTLYDFTGRRAQTQTTQNPRLGQINTDATRRSAPGQDTPTSIGAGTPSQSLSPENPRAAGPSEMQRSDPNTQFSQFPGAQGQAPQSSFRQGGQANTRAEQLAMREASKRFVGSGGVGGAWHRYGGPAAQDLQTPPGFQPYHAPTTLGRFINPAIQLPQDIYQRMHGTQAAAAAQGDVPGMIAAGVQGMSFPSASSAVQGVTQDVNQDAVPVSGATGTQSQGLRAAGPKRMPEGKTAPEMGEERVDKQTDAADDEAVRKWFEDKGLDYDAATPEQRDYVAQTLGRRPDQGEAGPPRTTTENEASMRSEQSLNNLPGINGAQDLADKTGLSEDEINQMIEEGWTFGHTENVGGSTNAYYAKSPSGEVINFGGPRDMGVDPDNSDYIALQNRVARRRGPEEEKPSLLDELLGMEKPEGIDTKALTQATRDRAAVAQARASQMAASSAARTGMAPEAAAGMQAGLAQQMGAETAATVAQQEMQGEVANMQQQMSFYEDQANALFQQAQFEQNAEERERMIAAAMQARRQGQRYQEELIRLQHRLANEVTGADVFGGILGGIVSPFFGGLGGGLVKGMFG